MTDSSAATRPKTTAITVGTSVLRVVQADITTLEAEAIVFYARPDLALGSGFGSAIARRGGGAIKKELDQIAEVRVTEAVVTSAGTLKATFIVHAVGPVFQEPDLEQKLRATIVNALKLADRQGISQIAFPPMGAGFYGVPLPLCADMMLSTLTDHLSNVTGIRDVIVCANDAREYRVFESKLAAMGQPSR